MLSGQGYRTPHEVTTVSMQQWWDDDWQQNIRETQRKTWYSATSYATNVT
jgi:hypothetical protein